MSAVKADPREQRELLRVQDLDTAIEQATRSIAHPSQDGRLAELQPQAAEIRSRRLAASGELEDAKTELARVESDVEVVEARMKRDSDRVQQTASVKDVAALESELQALHKRRSDLEDIELTIMERVEGLEARLAEIDAEATEVDSKVAALETERAAEVETWERKRKDAVAERHDLSGAIGLGVKSSLLEELTRLEEADARLQVERGRVLLAAGEARLRAAGAANVRLLHRHGGIVETITPTFASFSRVSGMVRYFSLSA